MRTPFLAPFLQLLLVISFTQISPSNSCDIKYFTCDPGRRGINSSMSCGSHKFMCENSILHVQFHGRGRWYPTESIEYPESTLIVRDSQLGDKFVQSHCEFLYDFKSPIPNFNVEEIDPRTLFDCNFDSYNFSRDVFYRNYRCSNCGDYDLYYSRELPAINYTGTGNGSAAVEWVLKFQEHGENNVVNFSLKSVGFSRHCKPLAKCFGCMMRNGDCTAVRAENSSCTCSHLQCPGHRSKNKELKIGLGVGGVLVFFALATCGGFIYRKQRKGKGSMSSLITRFRSGSSDNSSFDKDPESFDGCYHKTPIFSYVELQEATGDFDPAHELGDGGFGVVFKGKLKDGRIVAVKRLYERNYRRVKQFQNEVEILNRLRHRNLVALYGCTSSSECQDLLLVYEYIPNGTVADHLHGELAPRGALTWPIRMTIAIEAADALAYLHAHHPQIIHRDVKTSNILLDNNYTVKVADFGLSRLFPHDVTHVSTAPQGTPGYVDPEYHQCYHLTDKSDVYSFGVVLAELISSKPAVDITRPRSDINLSNIAVDRIPKGLVGEFVDPALGFDSDPNMRRMVEQVAEVTFRCLHHDRYMRPTMEEVRETLKDIAGIGDRTINGGGGGNTRDDACLLKNSPSMSPTGVADKWISSSSTTPHASA